MTSPALTAEELLAWSDRTFQQWIALFQVQPWLLTVSCDIYKPASTVADLMQHIVVVEIRYAERLAGRPETPYEAIATTPEAIAGAHVRAHALFQQELGKQIDWEQKLTFQTISMGTLAASRKTILFHALLHGIRHYAQLATVIRQNGAKLNFAMDYLMMGAERA
jgi:uncharacterized damage-inducible protein DinB